jgi:uncharacterized GH25 family protein
MKLAGFVAVVAVGAGAVIASLSAATPPRIFAPQGVAPQGRGAAPPPGQTGANPAQPPPVVSTGIMVGRVIDAATGKPVAGATVTISGGPTRTAPPTPPTRGASAPMPALPPPRILTDSEGRFAFRKLTRGNYSLTATKSGYSAGAYGRMRPEGPSRSINLDDNERLIDVAIRIFKFASINGRLTDETGEPIVGAGVRSYRRTLVAGRRRLMQSNSGTTDDRGVYRIFNLVPGEYVVSVPMSTTSAPIAGPTGAPANQNFSASAQNLTGSAMPSPNSGGRLLSPDARFVLQDGTATQTIVPDAAGRWRGYATEYYPSSHTIAAAEPIILASGDERSGVDLGMRYVPVSNISGTVMGPNGPAANYVLRLISSDAGEISNEPETASASTDSTGAFTFFAVPSGQYVIRTVRVPREGLQFATFEPASATGGNFSLNMVQSANPPPQSEPLLWAQTSVSVGDEDVVGVGLALQEGFTISGRFEFTGSRPKPDAQRMTQVPVIVEPVDGRVDFLQNGAPSRATQDGRFTTSPRLPGKYLLRVGGAPSGFIVQSITVNGVDATEVPIDLTQSVNSVVITFTDLIASFSGTVRGIVPGSDPPVVVLFPADSTGWKDFGINPARMRMTRAGMSGVFSFGSLIRGDYFAAAIKDEVSSEWQDPAFLEVLSRTAERFTLGAGEKRASDLTITDAKPPSIRLLPAPVANPPSASSRPGREFQATPAQDHGPFVDESPAPQQVRDGRPPEAIGTGTISGRVILEDGMRPARLARVRVTGATFPGERVALTDDDGRYTVAWLPPGDYQVAVTKPAYLLMYYGGRRPTFGPGATVHVNSGQAITGIDVTLQRGAVIAGMVLDPLGQPAPGVGVQLMVFTMRDGDRVLSGAPATGSSVTNDRGEYRFYGIRAGSYVVRATPASVSNQELRQLSDSDMQAAIAEASRAPTPPSVFELPRAIARAPVGDVPVPQTGGRSIAMSPVFYPGSPRESDAGEIVVTAGQELNGVNLQLMLVPTARVEGRVIVPNGLTISNVGVSLVKLSGNSSSSTSVRRMEDMFQAVGVAAGHYFLTATLAEQLPRPPAVPGAPPPPPPMTYWAQQEIDMNGEDILNLALALGPSLKISGRVVFDGAPPPDMRLVQVRLETVGIQPISWNVPLATADASGAFTLYNVTPGKYRLTTSVSTNGPSTGPAWSLLSSTMGGQDSLVRPFEVSADRQVSDAVVTMTASPAEVSGKLVDGQGQPVTGMTIVLFPTDRNLWAMTSTRVNRTTRASTEGEFRFTATLPGEYYLAVLTDLDTNDWNDPAFKEQLVPASLKISVAKGEKKVQYMKIAK